MTEESKITMPDKPDFKGMSLRIKLMTMCGITSNNNLCKHLESCDNCALQSVVNYNLYLSQNKGEVTGEEVPEPKLICPVCGVEHEIIELEGCREVYYEFVNDKKCPLFYAQFGEDESAESTMKALIKAMEK